jgi:hypothetical protein
MRINHRVADGIKLALARRLRGIRFLLTLFERRAFAASSLACPTTYPLVPAVTRASALKLSAGAYSFASVARARLVTNGTVSAANFSLGGIGGGEGAVTVGATGSGATGTRAGAEGGGTGEAEGDGVGDGVDAGEAIFVAPGFSTLLKYKNPTTPIAAKQTSTKAAGHIQFGIGAAAAGFFFSCGAA